ncbi:MAG: DUF4388 domain-containing protein [Candidatus Aminicenantes bacterium]
MEEPRDQGNLSQTLFSQLIFQLWIKERTGLLSIYKHKFERHLSLKGGEIVVTSSLFPHKIFLKALVKKNIIAPSSAARCEDLAAQNNISLLNALHEQGFFLTSRLWKLMEIFIKKDLFSLFDCAEAQYAFDSQHIPQPHDILFSFPSLHILVEGIRHMRNYDLINSLLPPESEAARVLSPHYLHQINLQSHEKYVLTLLEKENSLQSVYQSSELGRKESQKVLFFLRILGLVSFSRDKNQQHSHLRYHQAEWESILHAFNHKFSYIYKYISKALGPVAFNVIEKSLEEIKPHLSSHFQNIKFDTEGKLDLNSFSKTSPSYLDEQTKISLIRNLNEILSAQVMAVKKNLGMDHETALVKNLEKTGKSS